MNEYEAARDRYLQAGQACAGQLIRNTRRSMAERLRNLADSLAEDEQPDVYGSGALIEDFEAEVAALLGKEAGLFMPSGTMAQLIALRIWSDRSGKRVIGLHPSSHLVLHEQNAYQHLYGLKSVSFGAERAVPVLADLEFAARDELAAVLYELPMREIGGQLPEWDELLAMSSYCRSRSIRFHMDGARLWQVPPFYGKNLSEIAALFDSVYVSFYKDLDGISGAMLLGNRDFIDSARIWLRRAGGNLISHFPAVLSAQAGLSRHLPDIPRRHEIATQLAALFNAVEGFSTWPRIPQANMFHLRITLDPLTYFRRAADWMERSGVMLLPAPRLEDPEYLEFELSIGDACHEKTMDEWGTLIVDFGGHLFAESDANEPGVRGGMNENHSGT
jgi:threonine aldolase